jgi:hypothetical protein
MTAVTTKIRASSNSSVIHQFLTSLTSIEYIQTLVIINFAIFIKLFRFKETRGPPVIPFLSTSESPPSARYIPLMKPSPSHLSLHSKFQFHRQCWVLFGITCPPFQQVKSLGRNDAASTSFQAYDDRQSIQQWVCKVCLNLRLVCNSLLFADC